MKKKRFCNADSKVTKYRSTHKGRCEIARGSKVGTQSLSDHFHQRQDFNSAQIGARCQKGTKKGR